MTSALEQQRADDGLRCARTASLLLDQPAPRTPLAVAQWFGAMQAQDAASGHWSLGVRCVGSTQAEVLAAFERREIVRTWPMRGTIHIVPAEDVRWMLDLTGPRVLAGAAGRRAALGISDREAEAAVAALDSGFAPDECRSRADTLAILADSGIDVSGQRAYHLLWYAAQVGITCLGPQRGAEQTFVRLAHWAPDQRHLNRDDALAELLYRYLRSHGPVSLQDFAGWSGLTMTDARAGAAGNEGRIARLGTGAGALWCTTETLSRLNDLPPGPVVALPGYDEAMLGYKDRSLHLSPEEFLRVVPGGNGVFRPTIMRDGRVIATWKRTSRTTRLIIEVEPFAGMRAADKRPITAALEQYAAFIGLPAEIAIS